MAGWWGVGGCGLACWDGVRLKLQGTNLIVANVLSLYVRIALVMGLTLFSTRWVVAALGKEDFGLYALVGILIVYILFIGNVMAASMQRFYAVAIGQKDPALVQKWFNCAFVMHFFFAVLLVVVGVPLGRYFLYNVLNIPDGRLVVCSQVYYLSIAGAAWTMLVVPYIGMFNAKQRIFELSFWNMIQAILIFGLALGLLRMEGDLLLRYAVGMVGIKMVLDGVQMLRVRQLFPECRLCSRYWFSRRDYGQVLSYSGWQLWSGLGAMLSNQGLGVLINVFSGPRANAGYGIANQVNGAVSGIGTGIYQAAVAEIFRLEGAGERERMIILSLRTSKFVVLLSCIWLLPLCLEMDYVLQVWLPVVPDHVAGFCRIILVTYAINGLISGYGGAVGAYGKVATYQAVQGTLLVLTFPLTWVLFHWGATPEQALLSMIVIAIGCNVYGVLWVKWMLHVPIRLWVKNVLWKCLLVVIPSTLVGWTVYTALDSSLIRTLLVFAASISCTLLSAWFLALDGDEHAFCLQKIESLLGRFRHTTSPTKGNG